MLGIVAGQALGGRACFLSVWQNELAGGGQPAQPLVMHWVDGLIYWNLLMWVFAAMYSVVFLYVLALTVLVPFGRRRGRWWVIRWGRLWDLWQSSVAVVQPAEIGLSGP